jgi:hypothetical protein
MPITVFGVTTSHHHRNDGCLSTISSKTETYAEFKAIEKKLEDYVTKDQVHDKNYIDKNFVK